MALRKVKVTFTNGDIIYTSMSPNLTDKEIRQYYKKGRTFNLGTGSKDKTTKVKSVRILK